MEEKTNMGLAQELRNAVTTIKTAILQSQARAVKTVNQEQLALYYGIGRFISENTRNNKWGTGALKSISERLKEELPGLRGFGVSSLKNMRLFLRLGISSKAITAIPRSFASNDCSSQSAILRRLSQAAPRLCSRARKSALSTA